MRILERLATQALRRGFDTLEVENKDGFEEVCGLKDGIGFGIARVRSSSPEGAALRRELYGSLKKAQRVALDDAEFSLRSRVWDSFGEDAFRVTLHRLPRSASAGRRGKISGHGSA
ncbi:MAG: hypothetical protein ACRD2N_23060 [Vicinamibacterales bacterium]